MIKMTKTMKPLKVTSSTFRKLCELLDTTPEDITSKCRRKELVKARRCLCLFLTKLGFTTFQIGNLISRSHSSVTYLKIKQVELMQIYPDEKVDYEQFERLATDVMNEGEVEEQPITIDCSTSISYFTSVVGLFAGYFN